MFEIYKIKKLLKPRKGFVRQNKTAFLEVFDATHASGRTIHPFTAAAKTLVAFGALLGIFAGMSVYADSANVAADNALYPLKRLGENVQLALTPASQKAQLQATFAGRRAGEISDLTMRKPTSTIITNLAKDLGSDVEDSVAAAARANLGDGKLNAFCDNVLSAISTSSLAMHNNLSIHEQVLSRFESECALTGGSDNATTTVKAKARVFSSPSTADTTSTASTTFQIRGGGSLDVIFGGSLKGDDQGDSNDQIEVSSTNAGANIHGAWKRLIRGD